MLLLLHDLRLELTQLIDGFLGSLDEGAHLRLIVLEGELELVKGAQDLLVVCLQLGLDRFMLAVNCRNFLVNLLKDV